MARRKPRPASATVSWTQVATADGYRVYWGTTSRVYSYSLDAGTNLSSRITNLTRGKTYYFAGKSYNQSGMSDYSNEVVYTPA